MFPLISSASIEGAFNMFEPEGSPASTAACSSLTAMLHRWPLKNELQDGSAVSIASSRLLSAREGSRSQSRSRSPARFTSHGFAIPSFSITLMNSQHIWRGSFKVARHKWQIEALECSLSRTRCQSPARPHISSPEQSV